jgi:hypothetical protein
VELKGRTDDSIVSTNDGCNLNTTKWLLWGHLLLSYSWQVQNLSKIKCQRMKLYRVWIWMQTRLAADVNVQLCPWLPWHEDLGRLKVHGENSPNFCQNLWTLHIISNMLFLLLHHYIGLTRRHEFWVRFRHYYTMSVFKVFRFQSRS